MHKIKYNSTTQYLKRIQLELDGHPPQLARGRIFLRCVMRNRRGNYLFHPNHWKIRMFPNGNPPSTSLPIYRVSKRHALNGPHYDRMIFRRKLIGHGVRDFNKRYFEPLERHLKEDRYYAAQAAIQRGRNAARAAARLTYQRRNRNWRDFLDEDLY